MKARLIGPGITAAMVLAAALIAVFFAGGGSMGLEDYFADLDKADQDVSDAFDAFGTIAQGQDLDEIKAGYQDLLGAIDGLISNMEDLDPPDVAKDEHDAALDALRAFRDEFAAAVGETEAATSLDELGEAFSSPDLGTASDGFTEACVALQTVADEEDVDASLGCAGEEQEGGEEPTPTSAP